MRKKMHDRPVYIECLQCGKKVYVPHSLDEGVAPAQANGWIIIEGLTSIILTDGREKVDYMEVLLPPGKSKFCSLECLSGYLHQVSDGEANRDIP